MDDIIEIENKTVRTAACDMEHLLILFTDGTRLFVSLNGDPTGCQLVVDVKEKAP